MKKFFEKYDLIKISGILILLSVVLTWFIPQGYYQGEMVVNEITRIGLTDIFNYGLLGIFYFYPLVTSLFVIGGFYQVLSKRPGYQRFIKGISEKLKGHAVPVVLIVSLLFAVLSSVSLEWFPLLAIVPFVITVLNAMKVDKISAFVATFGGILVGTLGSTYGDKVSITLSGTFGIEASEVLVTQTIMFVIAYIALAILTVMRLKKAKKDDKAFASYDKFEVEEPKEKPKKKPKAWPYVVGGILFVLTIVLAYLPWETWKVTLFEEITTKINEFAIAGHTIITYICGKLVPFGAWEIGTFQYVMLFGVLLMFIFDKLSLNELIKSFGEGFKKISKEVVILLAVYLVVVFAVMYPIVPVIIDWITGLADGFNGFLAFISAFIASTVGVEVSYVSQLAGSYFAGMFDGKLNLLTIIFQFAFGIASYIVPSGVALMLGLSYLDIKYKDWFKFIWKFLVAMLVVAIIFILILG